ncbi:recombinase [Rhodococcus sp. 05-2256-B2]|uniref:recombinase family protein n=1 Tax=unclassified Rhodococcus (in: high G+C Gram-positive bacteria) TaxID=192944 RepID=UPI000B9B99A9|nr:MULTISPECIES: recombinase family protein [unclassified Rhodococcus (in: high G+C Gram-positive bacteria)]OZD82923.1 recombinase [Rhodococcus sp. 05-2256-B4]OZD96182.1 recombinase [Rhodococcus sp. 05-2256-B2]OZD96604.1 recombinase [Rhodococcus sp. 05-2256-B3]OZD99580.1 recombinase [Rhodococcus sp. 05-2256-B1]
MQAIVYTRISKDRTGGGLGVERQRADCMDLAAKLGWDVVAVHSDNDISAYSGKRRPGYDAMLNDVRSGKAQAIVAWHPDRLHRRPLELESFIDVCETHRIEIRTVHAGTMDLSTASGKMLARMLGAAARHEVEHSIERQLRAKKQAAADGKYRGGRRPFGFQSDGVTHHEVEAQALREATSALLRGESIAGTVRAWNEQGLVTSYGEKAWTGRDLRRVVMRPRNAALIELDGQLVTANDWAPIVDPDDWATLVAMLTDPSRKSAFSTERKFLGTGIYVCGKCGQKMQTATQRGRGVGGGERAKSYRCSGGAHMGRVADVLDAYVTEVAIARLSQPDAGLLLTPVTADVDELTVRRDGIQARLDELAMLFADGSIDGSQLKKGTEGLRTKLAALNSELAEIRSTDILADLVLAGDRLREVWDAKSPAMRSQVIDALMTVTILAQPRGRQPGGGYFNPDCIAIEFKG